MHREDLKNCSPVLLAVEKKYNLCATRPCSGEFCTAMCRAGIWEGSPHANVDGPPYTGWAACCEKSSKEEMWRKKFEISRNCQAYDNCSPPRALSSAWRETQRQ